MPWNVVQTYPSASLAAIDNLRRQGFEYYNPLCRMRVVKRGRIRYRVGQLFPSYMFVRGENRWRSLLSTIGIMRLLSSSSEKPAEVPDHFIADIVARQRDGFVDVTKSKFFLGQSVRVSIGGESKLAIFDGQKDRDRVFVLMNFLGSLRRTEVNESSLSA